MQRHSLVFSSDGRTIHRRAGSRVRLLVALKEKRYQEPISRRVAGRPGLGFFQDLDDTFREVFVDLAMARDRLGNLGGGIVIPVVFPAMANEDTAVRFKLSDKIFALH